MNRESYWAALFAMNTLAFLIQCLMANLLALLNFGVLLLLYWRRPARFRD